VNLLKALTIVFLCICNYSVGQNAFGALHSNYTPTNSLYINPSSILDAKVWLDINIAGVGTYLNNDLVHLENRSLISAIRNRESLTENDYDFNHSRKRYHAYNRTFAVAPSVVWSQGDHAAAISLGGRSYTGVRRIPDFGAQFIENGVPDFTAQHDINYVADNIRVASISFAELKLTYAYTFLKRRDNMFMAGATFSKFFSVLGAGANVYDFAFLVDNDSIIDVGNLQADAVYAWNRKIDPKGGWGMDFGFTYQKMLRDATSYYPNSPKMGCTSIPYKYKIGVSIIDIGNIKFDPVLYQGYDFSDYNWLNYGDADVNEDNPGDLFEEQESSILDGQVRDPNKIRLPTFISGQFDYNLWASRLYVNATVIQGFGVSRRRFGLRHANSISVTPRYESYWFDFALPVSLYEYKYPQLGASFRAGPLTIGTDKLINWLFNTDVYGADFYLYLKVPIRYHPKCKDRQKGRDRDRNRRIRGRDNSPTKCTI